MSLERCWSLLKRTRVPLNHSKLQRLFIKALPGDGSPPSPPSSSLSSFFSPLSVWLSHSLSLSFSLSLASTQPLKTAGRESEREGEQGRDKGTQREKDQPGKKAMSVESNGQCLFLESIFFCCCSSSIRNVVLLLFSLA